MVAKNELNLKLLCFLFILCSCQNLQTNTQEPLDNRLASDNGQLDLSQSTLEQQNIEKTQAKRALLKAREKRIVILSDLEEDLSQNSEINVAVYARQTTNLIGEQIYNRLKVKRKKTNPCLRFNSADDAQRFFLSKNGPIKDFWNLDQDGDGFACSWNPEQYRKILLK